MNNKNLKIEDKFKEDLNSIKLNSDEKAKLRKMVFSHVEKNPIKSPSHILFPNFFFTHKTFSFLSIGVLIVFLGVSQVAASALPGEILYSIKVNVNEPLATSFSLTNESRAKLHVEIAEERLIELEKISKIGNPSQEVIDDLNSNFKENSEKSHDYISKIQASGDLSTANEIVSDFKTALDAHSEILPDVIDNQASLTEVVIQNERISDLDKTIDLSISSSIDTGDLSDIANTTLENSEEKIEDLKDSLAKIDNNNENKEEITETLRLAQEVVSEVKSNIENGNIKEAITLSDQINMIVNKTTTQIETESVLEKITEEVPPISIP